MWRTAAGKEGAAVHVTGGPSIVVTGAATVAWSRIPDRGFLNVWTRSPTKNSVAVRVPHTVAATREGWAQPWGTTATGQRP